ncbi:MAG: hypothetical protein HGA65_00025 [Oscillochloris sp.]|nr:hypothetical protein [Oscillochloris sp.]
MRDQDVLEDKLETPPAAEGGRPAEPSIRRDTGERPARRSASRPPRAIRVYQQGRASVGLTIIALLFITAWLLNGYFTARAVVMLGGDWAFGATVHLVLTAVELTSVFVAPALRAVRAPGWVHLVIWAIVLPFGAIDTLTSALGFIGWGLALGLPVGLFLSVGATVLAEVIAFLPEPMLVWLTAALLRVLKG